MSLALPFKSPSFTIYGVDEPRTHSLSLAVRIVDDFTTEPVTIPLRVSLFQVALNGRPKEETAIRNATGDFCFENLAAGNYVLVTEPDPVRDYYFLRPRGNRPWPDTFEDNVVIPNPGDPGFAVLLTPKPGYPFPSGATLARGRVVDSAGAVLNSAEVSTTFEKLQPTPGDPGAWVSVTVKTRTDQNGEFVLFFRSLRITPSSIVVTAVKGNRQATQSIQIREREEVIVPELKPS